MTRLLIVAPNWLGDAVMALPAVADVRRAWPDAAIAVSARRSIAPLFSMVDGVELAGASRPDVALLLPNSFRSALTAALARIPERWGYRADWRGLLLTRAIDRPARVHQVEYYQHLVRALDVPTGDSTPRLAVAPAACEAAARLLAVAGREAGRPLVGLAPGAAYGPAKRWPPAYFAEVARSLAADGVQPVVVGSAADAAAAGEVLSALGTAARPIDLVGRTDLPTLAGVLAQCRVVVSNDSGAMHLAAAVGAPVVAIFGPTDERMTAPGSPSALGRRPSAILQHPVWCRPCLLRECPLDHECMRGVAPSLVLSTVREVACL
ncbi:MAG: lipopolysaccharide heptosyltransferase II [Betaproteobacteria bacterium]